MIQTGENTLTAEAAEQRFIKTWESPTGLYGLIAEVNNRPLAVRYMGTSLAFFVVAIVLAILIRLQLAVPNNSLFGPDAYNGIFTMHGSTMLYLFAVPFVEGLGLYIVPMQIGSRDAAFPRLTSFGYWMYLFGGLTMFSSFFFGQVPDAGWTAYTPLSGPKFSGTGLDFWLLGLSMIEIAGISAAIEIVVTILKFRAPGMSIRQMQPLVWAYLVIGVMIIFAFTPLLIATLLLEMDRSIGTQFFNPGLGGSSLLWQHLFWFFGHPEVYIVFLPATGVVSAIIPAFARRPIAAYPFILAALVITGFVSFGLWTHHMFTAGLPELSMLFFSAASLMIALAAGIQVFAWVATLWGSRPRYGVPMLFVLGFFFIFINGGLTGVMVAAMPFDWQVHDTNFVVSHFHHVLIGGVVFPMFAGLFYWLPKFSGRLHSELWGRIAFGFMFVGFNLTFLPIYVMGLFGMRRRIYTYSEEMGVGTLNLIATFGSFILAIGFIMALVTIIQGARRGQTAGNDPWHGGSLEWSTSSPPPFYGFRRPPVVRDLYPEWRKASPSSPDEPLDQLALGLTRVADAMDYRPSGWRATLLTDSTNAHPQAIQYLPGPTPLPFFLAVAFLLTMIAVLSKSFFTAGVFALFILGMIGWWLNLEPELPEKEARSLFDKLGLPLLSSGRESTGWWGTLGLLATLATVLAVLIYSYFYLRLYSPHWPQGGLPRPNPGFFSAAILILAAGGIAQAFNSWAWRRNRRNWLGFGMLGAIALGSAFTAFLLSDLLSTPFSHSANAYASVYFTTNGFALLIVATAIALQAGTLARIFLMRLAIDSPRPTLWLQNSELFWFFAMGTALISCAATYLVPYLR